MPYVPNATDTAEPLASQSVESAALEFRTLKTRVNALAASEAANTAKVLQVPELTVGAVPALTTRAGKVLGFDAGGNPIAVAVAGVNDPSLRADLAEPSGASLAGYMPAGTGAVETTVETKLRESVSVLDKGASSFGDSATAFENARAQCQTDGIGVVVPSGQYTITDSSSFPDVSNSVTPVNVIAGSETVITGDVTPSAWGGIPCFGHTQGNTYNLIHYSYRYAAPNLAIEDPGAPGQYPFGVATDIVECVPGTSFRGNANASFQHAIGRSGVQAQIGSVNMLTRLESGFLGDGNGTEIDIDNYAVDRKGLGVIITGIGTKTTEAGIKITRGDTTSNWYYGIQVARARYGLYVDLVDEASPINGVYITGLSQDLLKLTPKDDVNPTSAMAYGTNAADSSVKWRINKNGSIESTSFVKATGDVIVDTGSLGVMMGAASGTLPTSAVACIVADAGGYGGYNDLIIQPRTGSGTVGNIRFYGGGASSTEQWRIQTNTAFQPGADNSYSLGTAAFRASVVYAGTGAINTSDVREKQQIRSLSDAEKAVAARLKSLIKAFKFNDAVQSKGDAARIHVGVIAQEVAQAFEAEGIAPMQYGILCYDEWDDQFMDHPAVIKEIPARYSSLIDAQGSPMLLEEAITVIVKEAWREQIRNAGNRYGVRHEELLAFIISAL